ncbi:hypothetical protein AOLI_G00067550 [Acnodon oligacanthus]
MGKISVRSDRKGRSDSAQSGNDGQQAGGLLTQYSPSTLTANLTAVDGGLLSAPAFSHNTVSGDVKIVLNKIDVAVTPTTQPVVNKNKRLAQEALDDDDTSSKTILRTPKKIKRKPQIILQLRRGKSLHPARVSSVRGRLTFDDVKVQPDRLDPLEDENEENKEGVLPPGGRILTSLVGEITGTRVTADYLCSECDSAVRRFRAKTFSVKCTKCRHSWKCAKLQCTCTAEMTIELSDRTVRTVVLSDPLLRSIVRFERQGYCNTDKIEKKLLKLGNIRVDFRNGHPKSVERIADQA